jgi:hypothetical protein
MKERDIVVFSETAEDEALLDKAEFALSQARATTKNIKYDDSALNIMVELGTIVDELGDEEVKKELEYLEDAVREANNNLESAVYGLEEPFEDLIRTLRNKIDDEEMDRQDQEWEDQKRREQEQESKLVAPTAKGKTMLDHMREPLVDGDASLANSAIDSKFINWMTDKSKDEMFPFGLNDLDDPKVLERLKQQYYKETGDWAGDGGNLRYGTPGNRRSRQEEGKLDGYYLEKDAMELWLQDNPGKTERDWKYIGVDVSDEYTAKVGGIKGRYLGKGASEWTRGGKKDDMDRPPRLNKITHKGKGYKRTGFTGESEDDVDYKNMRAGEFAKAHGDQWDLTTTEKAAEFLHELVEPILDSFESRDDLEAYMTDYMPVYDRKYNEEEAIKQAFELLPITGDAMPTENTKKLKEPSRSTYRHENITTGPTRSNVKLSELSPARDNSANERVVAVLIRSALTDPKGEDVYELFAELESINPELADLYKDVALHQYEVQIEEGVKDSLKKGAVAGGVIAMLLGINSLVPSAKDGELGQALKAHVLASGEDQDLAKHYYNALDVYADENDQRTLINLNIKFNPNFQTNRVKYDPNRQDVEDFLRDQARLPEQTPDGQPIPVVDPGAPIGNKGGADFNWPGDPNQQQEARRPTTSSTHSKTKDIKKHDPFHGHTHPEGNKPAVCSCITSDGPSTDCTKCGGTGQITSPLRNDPKVESLKWTPVSDKKSWWDK